MNRVILAVSDCDQETIEYVRGWLKLRTYTADDVIIKKTEDSVYVELRHGVILK